jgi:RNA polymerase sigma-70 factor (ECF subfamily)
MMVFAVLATAAARSNDAGVDAHLVQRILAGDQRAFTELYRRHVDRVFGLLTRLIGPIPEREDLVQQVFVDVHRALPGFRGEAAFATFLYRIVTRAAYDHLDRRRRHRAELGIDAYDELISPEASPADRVRQRRELVRAFELLASLKPKKRIAFVLVVVEGMSLGQVAALVGASEQAVKQRVLHARRELEALIERRRRREQAP